MANNSDTNKILDWLSSDLKIALMKLNSLKRENINNLFSHVRKKHLGEHQKAWETACVLQLSDTGLIDFDESDGEIVSTPESFSEMIKDSDKIWEIVVKAFDSVTGSTIWDEVSLIYNLPPTTEELPIVEQHEEIELQEKPEQSGPSWEDINKFFSDRQSDILLSVRAALGKLASGGKWHRVDLFPEPCPVSETNQRKFIYAALEEKLIFKEGERIDRKYWINPDRNDYDSFSLIVELVYPSRAHLTSLPVDIQQEEDQPSNNQNDGDILLYRLKLVYDVLEFQAQTIAGLVSKIDEISEKLDNLPGKINGR